MSRKQPALVLNIERIGWSKLRSQRRHDQRKGSQKSRAAHDPQRTKWNEVLAGSGDCVRDVEDAIEAKGAKIKSDAETPFNRFVLSASPEHFETEGRWDRAKIDAFKRQSMKWLRDEYGDGLVYATLHLDEATPHIHAVAVPFYTKETKHTVSVGISHHKHPATRGRDSYERLRRRAAASLDLDYGTPGNKPRTKKQREAEQGAVLLLTEAQRVHDTAQKRAAETTRKADAIMSEALADARQVKQDAHSLWDKHSRDIIARRSSLNLEIQQAEPRLAAIEAREAKVREREDQVGQDAAVLAAVRRSMQAPPVPEIDAITARRRRVDPRSGPVR